MTEFRLDYILDNIPIPTFIIDKNHRVKYWNRACEELTGYKKEEIIGTADHWRGFFSERQPLLADIVLDGVEEFYRKNEVRTREISNVEGKEDTYNLEMYLPHMGKWIRFRASLLRSNGEITGAIGTMEDVTGQKLVDEIVRLAEQEKAAILDSMNEVVIFQNLDHRVLLANRAAGEAVGMKPGRMITRSCYEIWFKRDEPCAGCPIERVRETGQPEEAELTTPDGRIWLIRGYPVRNKSGNLEGIVEVALEITEHKRAEEALKESEEKFRSITASAQDAIIMMDNEGKISYWNEAAESIFGYSSQEVMGKECHILLGPQQYHEAYRGGFSKFKEGGQGPVIGKTLELVGVRKDGTEFPVELSVSAVKLKGKWNAIGILRDITQRKQAEKALKESEEKYRTTFEHTGTAMVILREDTIISLVNKEFERLSGYRKEEVEGKLSWTKFVHPEDLKRMKAYHYARRKGEKAPKRYEFRFVDREGNVKNILLMIDLIPGTKKTVASLLDITPLKKLTRLLRALSEINELVAREREPEVVLKAVCEKLSTIYNAVFTSLITDGELIPVGSKGIEVDSAIRRCPSIAEAMKGQLIKLKMNDELCRHCTKEPT